VELAAALGEPIAHLEQTLQEIARTTVASLDRPRLDGEGGDEGDLYDRLVDEDLEGDPAAVADQKALHGLLAAAIAALPERERLLVIGHYQKGRSLRLIGLQLGVSEARMSQLHTRALRRLREQLAVVLADDPPPAAPPARRLAARPTALTHALHDALGRAA
jgi:RNA polymerase sigma factor FliA